MDRSESLARCGHQHQIGGINRYRLDDGSGQRVWALHGHGWEVTLLPDHGLDCGAVRWNGRNLTWLSPAGLTDARTYDPQGLGWLRTFCGGLVTTCGPTHFGPPCEDAGEVCGLHGRFHVSPAQELAGTSRWDDDGLRLTVCGTIEDAVLFGRRLRIERRWCLGPEGLALEDRIRNDGTTAAPCCLLYHCNLGWPLLGPASELVGAVEDTEPCNPRAAEGLAEWRRFHDPEAGFAEMVFYHRPVVVDGWAAMALVNHETGLECQLRWDATAMPALTQWRCLDHGAFVCGIEPGTAFVRSRSELRERGELPMLEAGEERVCRLQISCRSR